MLYVNINVATYDFTSCKSVIFCCRSILIVYSSSHLQEACTWKSVKNVRCYSKMRLLVYTLIYYYTTNALYLTKHSQLLVR